MTKEEIQAIQEKIGATPDGVWGPKSYLACKSYLKSLMPAPSPWPKSDDASMTKFYGTGGNESNLVSFSFPFPMYYDGTVVSKGRCHKLVKDSLLRVLADIKSRHGDDPEIMKACQSYGGIYNFRNMRGGSRLSKHSWGVAIDLDPGNNGNKTSWPQRSSMPFEIIEAFAREGWVSAAGFWGRDGMHFEACQP
jgi:hypothetical protein